MWKLLNKEKDGIYEDTHGTVSKQEPWRPHRRKGYELIESLQSGAQIYSYASSPEKYQMQKAAVEKEWENREDTGMAADESQKQKWGDCWSKDEGPYCSLCVVDGHLSSQKFGVGTTISNIQRPS